MPHPFDHRINRAAHVAVEFAEDHAGTGFAGVRFVSATRNCANCAHDGARDPEWLAEGGVEALGRCMNACSAADSDDPSNRWCTDHQTTAEFEAGAHCPAVPIASI